MINVELLKQFCAQDSMRPNLMSPLKIGDYYYFADGFICLRVPVKNLDLGLPEYTDTAPPVSIFETIFSKTKTEGQYTRLDSLVFEREENCETCEGAGKDFTCPECDGTGDIDLSNRFNDYTVECKTCGGR